MNKQELIEKWKKELFILKKENNKARSKWNILQMLKCEFSLKIVSLFIKDLELLNESNNKTTEMKNQEIKSTAVDEKLHQHLVGQDFLLRSGNTESIEKNKKKKCEYLINNKCTLDDCPYIGDIDIYCY
ncbi:MAG: hypothetical protein WC390_07140 [Sulfurimonas sp.]|jgi:hypothetical protein